MYIDRIWIIIDRIRWIKIKEYASKMLVIFDEDQFHHGDEPYTYSNLTYSFFRSICSWSMCPASKKALDYYWPRQNQWIKISDECVSDNWSKRVILKRLLYIFPQIEKRLSSKRATYVVYCPGEPYLYTDSLKPDPAVLQVLKNGPRVRL